MLRGGGSGRSVGRDRLYCPACGRGVCIDDKAGRAVGVCLWGARTEGAGARAGRGVAGFGAGDGCEGMVEAVGGACAGAALGREDGPSPAVGLSVSPVVVGASVSPATVGGAVSAGALAGASVSSAAVGASVGLAVTSSLGLAVGASVSPAAVGASVGLAVTSSLRLAVGASVSLGLAVGASVGLAVTSSLRLAVGA